LSFINSQVARATIVTACTVAALSCAHRPPPAKPARFADRAAFVEVRSRAYGMLERDLDGDGLDDAVVGLRVSGGWAAAAFAHTVDDERGHRWHATCQGPVVTGSELGLLAWVEMSDGPLVLVVGDEENPDELVQSLVLIDANEACAARLEERLVLVKPAGEVIAPGSVPAGVLVRDGALLLTDQPETVTLEGSEGMTSLLQSVRVRRISGTREIVEVEEGMVSFLEPRQVTATWQSTSEPMTLEMLTDNDDVTGFVARADEVGTLRLIADRAVSLLIVHHGCRGDADPRLQLRVGEGSSWALGSPIPPDSFVRAAGRSRGREGVRRDLLALREAHRELELELGPVERTRCVREVRAFGFKGTPANP